MPRQSITLLDVDRLAGTPDQARELGLDLSVESGPELFRRAPIHRLRGQDLKPFLRSYNHPHAAMPWAGLVQVDEASVVPDGLVVKNGRVLVGEALLYHPGTFPVRICTLQFEPRDRWAWDVDIPESQLRLPGVTVNLICYGWQIYGHWLIDVLPRLERLLNSGVAFDTLLFNGPARPWQLAMLEALEVDLDRCRFVDPAGAVDCERLILPTYDRFNSECRPAMADVFRRLRRALCSDEEAAPTRNLFVSRRSWQAARPLENRADVEALVQSLGFELFHPESLSFPEQVRAFAGARTVMGECGSGLHNGFFSGPGTGVGVIQSCTNANFTQLQTGDLLGHRLSYCIGSAEDAEEGFRVRLEDEEAIALAVLEDAGGGPEITGQTPPPAPPPLPTSTLTPPADPDGLQPLDAPPKRARGGLRRLLERFRA